MKNVHVRGGKTAKTGGFIARGSQKYFVIDSCSSTGEITNNGAGGICGAKSGEHGEIKISNCYSTGRLTGRHTGGIAGSDVGFKGNLAHITQCYSTGNINGWRAGGICGHRSGQKNGSVYITRCYSIGSISYPQSGGIAGGYAALKGGYVNVKECFSSGRITARRGGGICGSNAGNRDGTVCILDCYSRGKVHAFRAGGITGGMTGGSCCGTTADGYAANGNVLISHSYASGEVGIASGGVIGSIVNFYSGDIQLKYSLFNGGRAVGHDPSDIINGNTTIGISDNIDDIRGRLYQFGGVQLWDNEIWTINGTEELPLLRFQLHQESGESISTSSAVTRSRRTLPVQLPARTVVQPSISRKKSKRGG